MNDEKDLNSSTLSDNEQVNDRRDALKKLGKYAAYVAPFTVMALSAKAASVSGTGGKPASRPAAGH